MKRELLDVLRCPECGSSLELAARVEEAAEIVEGTLRCAACDGEHPIINGIPRFVPADNYAGNFGFQWNHFRKTQLDSHSGTTITADRFHGSTGWSAEELNGKRVLDVGCGAGRFAEVALACGAEVVAVDYSAAVDAAWANLGPHLRLHVVQGDIYQLPFAPGSFDYVYCLGVLQHTPDVEAAFLSLPLQVRPGGELAADIYGRSWQTLLNAKTWFRPITTRVPQERLFRTLQKVVPALFPVSLAVGRVPLLGRKLRRLIPISNYDGILPLSREQLEEWALLDTFDMLAPVHDHPQTPNSLRRWFERAGLRDVEIFHAGHLVGRGRR